MWEFRKKTDRGGGKALKNGEQGWYLTPRMTHRIKRGKNYMGKKGKSQAGNNRRINF